MLGMLVLQELECLVSQYSVCAQVSDIAIAVREGADAVMLSGETAYGKFPFKAVDVMSTVAQRTESAMLRFSVSSFSSPIVSEGLQLMYDISDQAYS